MSEPILSVSRATLRYGKNIVLQDAAIAIMKNDLAAFIGPNGSGKTTLLKEMMKTITVAKEGAAYAAPLRFGYVPQIERSGSFWPIRATDFLRLFSNRGDATIEKALDKLNISDLAKFRLDELSGGQRQKMLLARALLNEPDILLLDEPTQGMDVASEKEYIDILCGLHRAGATIVFVTHQLQLAVSAAQKIFLLHDKHITETTPDSLMRDKLLEKTYHIPFADGALAGNRVVIPSRSAV